MKSTRSLVFILGVVVITSVVFYKMHANKNANQGSAESSNDSTENCENKSGDPGATCSAPSGGDKGSSNSNVSSSNFATNPGAPALPPTVSIKNEVRSPRAQEGAVRDFYSKYPGRLNIMKRQDGSVSWVSGPKIEGQGASEAQVMAWVQELAPNLGVSAKEVGPTRAFSETDKSVNYFVSHYKDGYEVFMSGIQISATKEDGAIYSVASELTPIYEFDKNIVVQKADAYLAIPKFYENKEIKLVKTFDKPVLYQVSNGKGELAWHFEVIAPDKEGHVRNRDILVSAKSGQIIYNAFLTIK